LNFRKLEVTGFKSFADKVEIVFEPGTTAIVGPNGCGKSNICDAIKWALGEQSAKSLRCERMEDVIFNGGSTRRQLGMAQVALTVTNANGSLSSEYSEVEVGRRLFRSGESEYQMNRNRCLLKDIQELFMDTGLGINSYSLMEQGHIDLILNSSPQDRRLILEEAAGITKFRHRKRTSLRKLEATEQNLLRVNDILYELKRQVGSLKRQASKARRYQRYHTELKGLDTKLSLRKYRSLMMEFKDTQDKLTGSDDKMRSISAAMTKLEAELEAHRLEITESEEKLTDLRIQERKAQGEIEETESNIAVLKERRANLQQQQKRAVGEVAKVQEQLHDSDKQLSSIRIEKGKLSESIFSQENELKMAQERADELAESVMRAEDDAEELKAKTIEILNRKAKAQNELSAADSRLDYLVTRQERLIADSKRFHVERSKLEAGLAKLQEKVKAGENEINELKARQKQVDSASQQLQPKIALMEKNVRETERERGTKASRLQSLQELQEAYEGYNAGVKAILGGAKERANSGVSLSGIYGVIAEIVSTEPRYELAIEASLGNSVQGIITETVEDARAAVEYLKKRKSGRATLLPVDIISERAAASDPAPPTDGALAIASQVVSSDARYSLVVECLLGNTLIVEDLDAAVKLARTAHDHTRYATLDGQVVSHTGAITGGTGSEGAGLLRRSREIGDLKKEVAELSDQVTKLTKDRDGVAAEISSLRSEKDKIASELQRKQISHTSAQKDLSQYKQQLERLGKEISVVESECDALERDIVVLEDNKNRFAEDTAKLEKQSAEIEKKIGALQAELRSKTQQRDAVTQQCTNIKIQLASKKQQERGLAEKLKSMERARERLAQTLSSHQTSASSDVAAGKKMSEEISTQAKRLEELFRERTRIEGDISKLETQRQKAQTDVAQGEAAIREHRRDVDQSSQGKYQLEVTKTQLQMNIDSLVSKMRERYGVSIEELQEQISVRAEEIQEPKTETEDAGETSELTEEELMGRIEELRIRMDKMGSVNLTAVDEYNRQQERYDLLITQKDDLLKAKESLYNIIQKISRESRERLKETFGSVNASFQELFKRLFGGGHAELVLTGDGDVLESGVDITARPPGKKLQAISMLSSGERSLTAIALLFALFEIRPSPFCVLDEVDAALDDANVGRFTDMVQEFAKDTQFIIITHNKRTMEIADVLYGVTMEESGVSKLVSLRMKNGNGAKQLAS